MRRLIWALVAVMLLATGPAFAGGGEKGDWEIGGFFGFRWFDDYDVLNPDDDNIYGLRLGHFLSRKVSLEASGQWGKTDTEFDPTLGLTDTEMKLNSWRLNLLYNFGGPGGFRPFLTAGVGLEKFKLEDYDVLFPTLSTLGWPEDGDESSDFSFNGGLGFRVFFSPAVNLRVDGRYVRSKVGDAIDNSQNNLEATAGLSLLFGGGGEEEVVSEAAPNQPPSVTCTASRSEILPGETVNVSATATDPEGDPLTFEWTTSAGRVSGSGAGASLDFTGATPPMDATVTVRVTDNHGNSATSDCAVRLIEPQRRAEAVSCIAGGFARNISRITNVDKACLDDVAQRLSADPRATVVIVGHSDAGESTADIAQRRGDAVRAYLVDERRVDGARITVRSASATKPMGSADQNRRVVVWFVPEGATVQE